MNRFGSIFRQVLQLFPRSEFQLAVRKSRVARPACGDLDADGLDEIAVGLGDGGGGCEEGLDDASAGYARLAWPQVPRASYNSAGNATWPAVKE